MNPFLSKYFFYLPVQSFRGEPILKLLKEYKNTEELSVLELKQYQRAKLAKLLDYAFRNIEYFRILQKKYNLDLKSDPFCLLAHIPVMKKQVYIANIDKLHADTINGKIDSRQTSGSSGIPLHIVKDRISFARHRAIMYRYYLWHGIDIGDRQCRFFGHPVTFLAKLKEDIQDFILNKYRLDPVYMGEEKLLSFYQKVKKLPECYFYGYASAIDEFAHFIKNRGLDSKCLNISCVITAGETLYESQRKNIERTFRTKVINEYGCSEVGIVAFMCPYGNMHLADDNLLVEIIKDGKTVEPGYPGEIVVTELNNYSVPFIRYALGDIGTIKSESGCKCGRPFRILEKLEGRTSQIIKIPSGRKVHTEVFHYISDVISEKKMPVEQFRIVQKSINFFEIQIVLIPESMENESIKAEIKSLMMQLLAKVLGEGLQYSFVYLDKLPKDLSGKLRYFISELAE